MLGAAAYSLALSAGTSPRPFSRSPPTPACLSSRRTPDPRVVSGPAHQGGRKLKGTKRRNVMDFAACMRDFSDIHFSEADRIRVVLDSLSTCTPAALYNALPAEEARRILRRIQFH